MKLYNSLTKKAEEFAPLKNRDASIYSCGPTVYNNLHIGNLSAFIYADTLRRTLSACGYKVDHVMNITDVDDKTIRDSKRDYPEDEPMIALKKLTDKYRDVFEEDLERTGCDIKSIKFISAVDSINDMIKLIQKLLDNGVAYEAEDGIYFSISEYVKSGHEYGKLQKVSVEKSEARIANDEYDKDNASDFALWKKAPPGEPIWEAKFRVKGKNIDIPGRPGWHIECSAMSEKTLGTPFDIHTGGIDLKFPHHENEIAQTCGAGADDLANFFVHNNHILVDGRKMSKSLGNVITLREIEAKGFSPLAFRLLVLESHYRNESNFSWDILRASQTRLNGWQATVNLQLQIKESDDNSAIKDILYALEDDMNTPQALALIDTYFNKLLNSEAKAPNSQVVKFIEDTFGITFDHTDITEEIKKLLEARADARATKDWQRSDALRDEIRDKGIGISDSPLGQIWYRI